MPPESFRVSDPGADRWRVLALVLLPLAALWGCTTPARSLPASIPGVSAVPEAPRQPVPAPAPAAPPAPAANAQALALPPPVAGPADRAGTADALLAYGDSIRNLPPTELAQEIRRLGDPGESAAGMMRLALALGTSRIPANITRAQSLLQRVLAQTGAEAQALHPLARLLASQQAEARRLEDQLERQRQELREAQRRIEQLSDRLEAVRAIERSLPPRPSPPPRPGQRPETAR